MTLEDIKLKISTALPNATVFILDPMNDGQHLQAIVVSPDFEGLPVFKQHQLVMNAVKDIFQIVHALEVKTFTPSKWQEAKPQYVE